MNIFKRCIYIACVVFTVSGCAQPIMPVLDGSLGQEHVVHKNYKIDEIVTANVGDTMIRVKDYTVKRRSTSKLAPSDDFTIGIQNLSLTGKRNVPISIAGIVRVENEEYYLLQSAHYSLLFPISKSGHYLGGSAFRIIGGFHSGNEANVKPTGKWKTVPEGITFSVVEDKEIDAQSGYINYEILYTGVSSNTINLMYREYTKEDMARPAFYQNLSYPKNEKSIRFRSLKMEIVKANAEEISFRVRSE